MRYCPHIAIEELAAQTSGYRGNMILSASVVASSLAPSAAEHWYTNEVALAIAAWVGLVLTVIALVLSYWFWLRPSRPILTLGITRLEKKDYPEGQRHSQDAIIELTNRSRRDIRSEDFDGGNPLVLELSEPIIGNPPEPEESAHKLEFGPALIRTKQTATCFITTESWPEIVSIDSPLADVQIVRLGDYKGRLFGIMSWGFIVAAFISFFFVSLAEQAAGQHNGREGAIFVFSRHYGGLLVVLTIAGLVMAALCAAWRSRLKDKHN